MSYRYDKETGDIVIAGWEEGIASSPHAGLGNIQCANVKTIPGEIICNYARAQQSQAQFTGSSITAIDASHLKWTDSTHTPFVGECITPTSNVITAFTHGSPYYIKTIVNNGDGTYSFTAAATYGGTTLASFGLTGTVSFTLFQAMGKPVAWTTTFQTATIQGSGVPDNFDYYVIDVNAFVWRFNPSDGSPGWTNIDPNAVAGAANSAAGGIFCYGLYLVVVGDKLYYKSTQSTAGIGSSWSALSGNPAPVNNNSGTIHYALLGHDSVVYFCDGQYIDSLTVVAGSDPVAFDPTNSGTFTFSQKALTLPSTETTTFLAELGTNLMVGCYSSNLYSWNRTPISIGGGSTLNSFFFPVFLPEQWVQAMVTVNNLLYVFCGNKGNIYVTNGTTVTAVLKIPDYVTGQIEPYYIWGGAMYLRGRIWFSVQDSNNSTGGIWSFIPQQSYYIEQDTGQSLRLENQNSYATYAGMATILIPTSNAAWYAIAPSAGTGQLVRGSQYWAGWTDGAGNYGIDFSSTNPYTGGQVLVDSDLIPIGSYIDRGNFTSVQTRLSAPLVSGESVKLQYRVNLTDSWTDFADSTGGIDNTVGSVGLRWPAPFANALQVQIRAILTSTASSPSFVRLKEIRLTKFG